VAWGAEQCRPGIGVLGGGGRSPSGKDSFGGLKSPLISMGLGLWPKASALLSGCYMGFCRSAG